MTDSAELRHGLVARARQARARAYAPYSGYTVGAALQAVSGQVFEGVNVENAVYPAGVCAERAAVYAAVSQGVRQFNALAVVTQDGASPCGICRQVLSEFNPDLLIWLADAEGRVLHETTVRALLPEAFGPANLGRG